MSGDDYPTYGDFCDEEHELDFRLKPCPICPDGGDPLRMLFSVYCSKCGLETKEVTTASVEEVVAAWNNRPREDKLLASINNRDAFIDRLIDACGGRWDQRLRDNSKWLKCLKIYNKQKEAK